MRNIIKAENMIGTQRNISIGGERKLAVKPASRAPIVDPTSNIVIKVARARVLSSDATLSLSSAVDGATRIPHPTPYRAMTIIR